MKFTKTILVCTVAVVLAAGTWAQAQGKLRLDGSTTVGPIAKAFAEYYMTMNKDVNVLVSESGSGTGAKSLINGSCDIANMSRFMKDKEFKAAVTKDITPVAHVVAMDGIAIAVHPSNPVKGLTVAQVRDIYAGKITNWKEVGGPNKAIVVVSRDTTSGTYETFYKLVMTHKVAGKKVKEKIKSGAEKQQSNGAVRNRIQSTAGAVGYVGLGYLDRTIKAVKVNGVEVSKDTVASGQYPVARPLFMFTNGYPKLGSHVHAFVTLHLSKKGQEIIDSVGFVPVTKY
jgi:phosphate transport system substrate-binding protein